MRGGVAHPTGAAVDRPARPARRAHSAFTRICDEALGATRRATQAGEAIRENATAEILSELALNELRASSARRALLPRRIEERLEVTGNDTIQRGLLRLVPLVRTSQRCRGRAGRALVRERRERRPGARGGGGG